MAKRIYVGNLPFTATEDEIRQLFAQYGAVESVTLASDRRTGQPRGFGFVEMSPEDADQAIAALHESELGGRQIKVNEARQPDQRSPGRGRGR
jgi:RNA recognition motif-containing protein